MTNTLSGASNYAVFSIILLLRYLFWISTFLFKQLHFEFLRYVENQRCTRIKINQYKCSFEYVEMKCQLDATEVFIADLIACSTCFGHHYAHRQELKSIIQWLLPVVLRAVVFQVAGLVWS